MIATKQYEITAVYICILTAFSVVPQKDLIFKCCFIHLKNLCRALHKFFKECKQYLNLGKCKSSCFDAQIADTTITMLQHIMLSYYKRITCQQSFSGLFESISKEMVELDLVTKMVEIIWELIEVICSLAGIDFMELQVQLIKDDKAATLFMKMIPKKVFDNAA